VSFYTIRKEKEATDKGEKKKRKENK